MLNVHFHGWKRIKDSMYFNDKLSNFIIIDYIDKYFQNNDKIIGSWIGFIHHTSSNFSSDNITNLFELENFVNSLNNCKYIFTLSNYNKINILNSYNNLYYSDYTNDEKKKIILERTRLKQLHTKKVEEINKKISDMKHSYDLEDQEINKNYKLEDEELERRRQNNDIYQNILNQDNKKEDRHIRVTRERQQKLLNNERKEKMSVLKKELEVECKRWEDDDFMLFKRELSLCSMKDKGKGKGKGKWKGKDINYAMRLPHIKVLKHPMPPVNKTFDIEAFTRNPSVCAIGAWLRNPYTIYRSSFNYENSAIQKYRLKGLFMEDYFPTSNTNNRKLVSMEYKKEDTNYKIVNINERELYIEEKIREVNIKIRKIDDNLHLYRVSMNNIGNVTNREELEKMYKNIQLLDLNYEIEFTKLKQDLQFIKTLYTLNDNLSTVYSRGNDDINYYEKYAIEYVKTLNNYSDVQKERMLDMNNRSVNIINKLNDDQYLELLTQKVIFCDYIDCSASNTIVECIATSTPIILNKLPSIVEYLGENYPLYIENIADASTGESSALAGDTYNLSNDLISRAHEYLKNMNKDDLTIEHFNKSIEDIVSARKQHVYKYYMRR